MKQRLILTFDLEFWYCSGFMKKHLPDEALTENQNDYTEKSIDPILELLAKNQNYATFFVLGKVAQKYPQLIKKIHEAGHEIASHGFSHRTLGELDRECSEKEIKLCQEILKNVTGEAPKGFRAPDFSLNKKTSWAKEILEKNFLYDSSAHPIFTKKVAPGIKEIFPSLGGFYFRVLHLKIYIFFVKHCSKNNVPVLYFHPNELFDFMPKIESGPWIKRKIKYLGTKNAWKKFQRLLEHFNFISIEQYLNENTTD